MFAAGRPLAQRLRMDRAEDGSALSVRDGNFDPHQARRVHNDAVESPAVPDDGDELTFAKRLHEVSLLARPAVHYAQMCSNRDPHVGD
jgi:hypothetical protein